MLELRDIKRLIAADILLATRGIQEGSEYAALVPVFDKLGLPTEIRGERHFYRRGVAPLFRSTPMPETRGRKPRLDREKIRKLRSRGYTYEEIAEKLECTPDGVRKADPDLKKTQGLVPKGSPS